MTSVVWALGSISAAKSSQSTVAACGWRVPKASARQSGSHYPSRKEDAMPAKGSTVLVVEDDVDMREMVELTLSGAGYKVMTAGEGREALDKVAVEMPKAIILDMKMP